MATDMTQDLYVNKVVRACGVGSIDNYPTFSRKVKCVNLTIVAIASCSGIQTNTFCTDNNNDHNICNGKEVW